MAYEGGYTSAVNAATDRERIQTGTKALLQQMMQQDWLFQQQQQRQRDLDRDLAGGIETYLKAFGKDDLSNKPTEQAVGPATPPSIPPQAFGPPPSPPQIPFPGMPSIPNLPPQIGARPGPVAAQGGPPGAPPATPVPPGAGAPPGGPPAPPGGAPQAAPPAAPAAPPAPPPGWQPSPAAGPNLGGPPPGAPPGMGGPGAKPQPAGIAQGQMYDPMDFIKEAKSRGVPPLQIARQLEQMLPVMNEHNATVVKEYAAYAKIMDETNKFLREQVEAYKAETQAKNVASLISARTAEHAGEVAKAKFPYTKAGRGSIGKGADPGAWSPENKDPAAAKNASDQLDLASWDYIVRGVYPSRKGKFDAGDFNRKVYDHAVEIMRELKIGPQDLLAIRAEYKADGQSLTFQTKKVDAVQSTLASFHNNIKTWDAFAKGEKIPFTDSDAKKFAAIDFSGVKGLDDIQFKIRQQFNDPAVAGYLTSAMTVAMDFARIMQGPQSVASLTEGARADAERLISAGFNNEARAAIIRSLESDAQGQVKGLMDQREAIRTRMSSYGKTPAGAAPAAGADPIAAKVKAAGVPYEPDKYDYRVQPDGTVQRKAK